MKTLILHPRFFFAVLAFMFFPAMGYSAPDAPLSGFDHLLQVVKSERQPFDPEKITSILDYVGSDRYAAEPSVQKISGMEKTTYAYGGFESEGSLSKLVKYCYNPDIPSCAVMPSVIRLSTWKECTGNPAAISPAFWQRNENEDKPLVIRGTYYMQNTPDASTGAYYGYDSYRTVILMTYKGRNVLVSVMKQKDVSDVGKKGFIIGDEGEMDYFYSGEKGLTMKGLGWVKSYLYDSLSVSVFMEDRKSGKNLRCGVFKWIRAGWAGSNIVRKSHMKKGMDRYAAEFKNLMQLENRKHFPSPEELADICNTFKNLPTEELKKRVERLLQSLHAKCGSGTSCPKIVVSGFDMEGYVNTLSRTEMSSALIVDYVKNLFGKSDKSPNIALKPGAPRKPEAFSAAAAHHREIPA
jgi:hypothetical protein